MAKQSRKLPARRKNGNGDDSLLIRSAESLGRMIGALQRQLDAARQLTLGADGADGRGDGHAPARKRAAKSKAKAKTAKTKAVKRAAKTAGVRSKQQRERRARESSK